jgi:hypothetical protein
MLLTKLRHRINKFEAKLREANFPGWGDTYEKNVVRTYVHRMLNARVDRIVNLVARGSTDPEKFSSPAVQEEYTKDLRDIYALLDADPLEIFRKRALQGDKDIGYKKVSERSLIDMVPGVQLQDQLLRKAA